MTAILEAQGLTVLKLEQLIGYLIIHEIINSIDEKKKKKKDLVLKASIDENDGDDDDEFEEVDLLYRKFKWFLMQRREGITEAPRYDSNDVMKCYKCPNPDRLWKFAHVLE